MSVPTELRARAERFLENDVEDGSQAELTALLARDDEAALAELEDRFSGPLTFGTAGLRGLVGAGDNRMNRAVVIRATYGMIRHLLDVVPDAKTRGIVIGRDGRHMSFEFQQDVAGVCMAQGVKVYFLEGPQPTPLIGFGVKHLNAAAGVAVTASHNPPAYNGYKVFWANGAQIVPPVDKGIAQEIQAAPPAKDIARLPFDECRAREDFSTAVELERAYLAAIETLKAADVPVDALRVAYTAMHGVGRPLMSKALGQRGVKHFFAVPEQAEPDPDFPTVDFPNPEEKGALDLVKALAKRENCDLILANDPDADRLAIGAVEGEGYRILTGNEAGIIFADYLLEHLPKGEKPPLLVTTIVSSQQLKALAKARGAEYEEVLTGFKWIADAALRRTDTVFLFGYEEALGYTIRDLVRDKDGISTAAVIAEIAATEKARGRSILDRLADIREAYGVYFSLLESLTLPGSQGRAQIDGGMAKLRASPPWALGGVAVSTLWDLKAGTRTDAAGTVTPDSSLSSNVLVFDLDNGGRICVRPSGTEPKIKFYVETVVQAGPDAESSGRARLRAMKQDIVTAAGFRGSPNSRR